MTPKMMPLTKGIRQKLNIQGHTCLPTIDVLHVVMPPQLLILTPSGRSGIFCLHQGLQLVQLVVCQGMTGRRYGHQRRACRHSVLMVVHCDGAVKWGTQILQSNSSNSFVMRGTSPELLQKAQDFQHVFS